MCCCASSMACRICRSGSCDPLSSLRKQGPITASAREWRSQRRELNEASCHLPKDPEYGSPEFTNEVQHFRLEVLPWGGVTSSFPLTIDARLPGFLPMAARCGKSRQLWIARHQRFLGS